MAFKILNDTVIYDNKLGSLSNLTIDTTSVLVGDGAGNVTLQNVTLDALTVDVTSFTTDDITEGATNLYYTDARVNAIVNPQFTSATADRASIRNEFATADTALDTSIRTDFATADAATLASAQAYADSVVSTGTGSLTTDDVAEGANLYYTDTRVNTLLSTKNYATESYVDTADAATLASAQAYADSVVSSGTGSLTTDDIAEGANLYYTDTRVNTLLATKNYATESYVDTAETDAISTANAYTDARETAITTAYQAYTDTSVANIVDTAPAALDTLNELAAALGDDANFATTVATDIGTKVSKSGDTMTGALTLSGAPTNPLHATTKAYVDSAVSTGTGSLDTDSVPEGATNLYYTNARVDARIPTNISAFTNDSGYLTSHQDLTAYALKTELFSGSYTDLTNKPTIPTNNNQLTNGAGYVTTDTNTTYSAGNGIGLSSTTFSVAAGNGLTQQADGLAMSGSYTGNFTASGDVTAYSDRALKRNIQTIEGALEKVTEMRGVTFLKDGKASTGVIAQEIETVLPEVVHQDNYGMRSVAYGNIVGTLIEAIKEQQVQIEKLQSEIAEIKKK